MFSRFLLVIFLFVGVFTWSQTDSLNLYLINPNSKAEKLIKEGKWVRVWKSETDVIKGKYTLESDSTIKIGDDIYALKELNSIKCSTRDDRFGSAMAGLLPVILTVLGVVDLANNTLGKGTELFIGEVGVGAPLIGLCTYGFLHGRQRKIEKGWKYVIK